MIRNTTVACAAMFLALIFSRFGWPCESAGGATPSGAPANAGGDSSVLDHEQLSRTLLQLKAQRDAAAARYGKDDPGLQAIEASIASLQEKLGSQRGGLLTDRAHSDGRDNQVSLNFPRIVMAPPEAQDFVPEPAHTAAAAPPSPASQETAAEQTVRNALAQTLVSLKADQLPLSKFIDTLREQSHCNFDVNWSALQAAAVDRNTPVSMNLNNVSLEKALSAALSRISPNTSLGYTVDSGVISISTKDELNSSQYLAVRMYNVRDLIALPAGSGYPPQWISQLQNDRANNLMDTLKTVVAPDSWRDAGGTIGSVREIDGVLIVSQSKENQWTIQKFLAEYRAIRGRQN